MTPASPEQTSAGQLQERLLEIFRRLLDRYGPQSWWPGDGPFETILGAILTQSAAWTNVERALANLKRAGVFSPEALRRIPQDKLAELIRPSVYFNAKARKVKAFVEHLGERYGDDLEAMLSRDGHELREELLSLHGIGEETADDIMLYAAERPFFVIDAYTRRLFQRLGLAPERQTYREWQEFFHRNLPRDVPLYNEYHALIDEHCVQACRPKPLCGDCCLLDLCPAGQQQLRDDDAAPTG